MAELPTMEERFAQLESRVAELERQRRIQEDRDVALLARVDGFIDDLRRMERVQMRSFEELIMGQKEHGAHLGGLDTTMGGVVDTLKDHKTAIEVVANQVNELTDQVRALAVGQQQIVALLTDRPPLHD